MQNLKFERLADLDCLILQRSKAKGAIILLHGYGADFSDLTGIADLADPHGHWDWYFPNAPWEIPLSPYSKGRAWFPIDMYSLENAMRRGLPAPFADQEPDGLSQASVQLVTLAQELIPKYPILGLGGFSQGAMVSCDALLHLNGRVPLLLQLSGTLVAQERWQRAIEQEKKSFRVFQSHGRQDPVLPFKAAEMLNALWTRYEIPHTFVPFLGGHEVPYEVLRALQVFLSDTVS